MIPFPLSIEVTPGFLKFCGTVAGYTIGTVEDVIKPSLTRMEIEKFPEKYAAKEELEPKLYMAMKNAMQAVRKHPDAVKGGTISFILAIIVKASIPHSSSLFSSQTPPDHGQ
jgi:hypothetical protein